MKIVYLAFNEELDNTEAGSVHINSIINGLVENGADVYVFSRSNISNSYKIRVNIPVGFKELFSIYSVKAVFEIIKIYFIVLKIKPDIIYERFAHPNIYSLLLGIIVNTPRILEVNSPISEEIHNYPIVYYFSRLLRKIHFYYSNAIITQTETLAKFLQKETNKPIYIVPNGFEASLFNNFKLKKTAKNITITFLGTFKPWHGANQLIEIINSITSKYKNVEFCLIGDGQNLNNIKQKVIKRSRVNFVGKLPHHKVNNYLKQSDILIAPFDTSSYKQLNEIGFWWNPIKLYEYMAAGRPIVSYKYKEIAAIVGLKNLLAKPNNINDFIHKIELLITNSYLRDKIALNNYRIANKKYTWKIRSTYTFTIISKYIKYD